MDLSSLPSYPPPVHSESGHPPGQRGWKIASRQARVLFDLALLACIVVLLVGLGQVADVIRRPSEPRGPLDFKTVQEKFAQVHFGMSREEVFHLLGPQRWTKFREPEFERIEAYVEARPDRFQYPDRYFWTKWADPQDEGKWVAVFFADERVYEMLKKGY